jgi:hypothetical protein
VRKHKQIIIFIKYHSTNNEREMKTKTTRVEREMELKLYNFFSIIHENSDVILSHFHIFSATFAYEIKNVVKIKQLFP